MPAETKEAHMAQAQQGQTKEPTEDPKVASGKVVVYVGLADNREIDVAAWRNADVNDQDKKVTWNAKNKWTVPVSDLSDSAVAYCESGDDGFVVKDAPVDK